MKNFFKLLSVLGFIGAFFMAGCADADSLTALQIFLGASASVSMMAIGVYFNLERGAGR